MMNFAYRFLITMAFLGPNIYQITRRGIFQSIRWNGVVAFQSMAPKCSSSTRTQNYASNHHQYQPLALALHKHHLSIAAASSSFTQLFMSSDDENDNAETIPTRTSFNIPILKKETVRLVGDDESWADDSNDDDGIPLVDGDNPSASWGLMDAPYKMVLCVNTSLGMGKGKIAAQCGHAAVGCYKRSRRQCPSALSAWERTGCAKIAVKCPSDDEMVKIIELAAKKGLPMYLVEDAGRTQIAAGSRTVLGIGPAPVRVFEGVTSNLKLM